MQSAWLRLLLLFGGFGLLAGFLTLPGGSLLSGELQNTGHTLLFAVLAILSLRILHGYREAGGGQRDYLVAGLLCLLAGIAIELLQIQGGRGFSITDIARDTGGMLAGLALYAAFDGRLAARRDAAMRRNLLAGAAILVAVCLAPLALLSFAAMERSRAFPVLLDLASYWSHHFSSLKDASRSVNTTGCSNDQVLLQVRQGDYPGVIVSEPYPDWRGYRSLLIPVTPRNPDLRHLWLRIHDAHHDDSEPDRFTHRLELVPGDNMLRIGLEDIEQGPAGRTMDMARIAGLALYSVDVKTPFSYCLGRIMLE